MDGNYLMRKEGLTMTNEDLVKHQVHSVSPELHQGHPTALATRPQPQAPFSSPAGAKWAEQTLQHLWLLVLVAPSHVLGLRAAAANVAGTARKNKSKEGCLEEGTGENKKGRIW